MYEASKGVNAYPQASGQLRTPHAVRYALTRSGDGRQS